MLEDFDKVLTEVREQQEQHELSMKAHKEAVEAVPKFSEDLKNSAQQIKKFVNAQGKDSWESNIILHNTPESSSQDPAIRKQHDENTLKGVVSALPGSNTKVEIIKDSGPSFRNSAAGCRKIRWTMWRCKKRSWPGELSPSLGTRWQRSQDGRAADGMKVL